MWLGLQVAGTKAIVVILMKTMGEVVIQDQIDETSLTGYSGQRGRVQGDIEGKGIRVTQRGRVRGNTEGKGSG